MQTWRHPGVIRRPALITLLALMLTACGTSGQSGTGSSEPIVVGVSGPLTGPNAQYGAQWKQGFDLALDEINGGGGINGRKLQYEFEDSQSDPKQSVVVAQKFVADPRIVAELGDFSSTASMAASPIYQRAEQLRQQLAAHFAGEQLAAIDALVHSRPLDSLAQDLLAGS